MTAVAFRHARFEEDDEFNEWVSSLTGGEPVEQGAAIDPAAMQVEMPDIPVAGSGEDGAAHSPPDVEQPQEPYAEGYLGEAGENAKKELEG